MFHQIQERSKAYQVQYRFTVSGKNWWTRWAELTYLNLPLGRADFARRGGGFAIHEQLKRASFGLRMFPSQIVYSY
jgi:hypothetical protein